MPKFSKTSNERKKTCHILLQKVLDEVIKYYDFTILCGTRTKEEQDEAYKNGNSTLQFPHSKHNRFPSYAVDIAPYPVNWEDINRFFELAGVMKTVAQQLEIPITWGGDWKTFKDYPHWEVKV